LPTALTLPLEIGDFGISRGRLPAQLKDQAQHTKVVRLLEGELTSASPNSEMSPRKGGLMARHRSNGTSWKSGTGQNRYGSGKYPVQLRMYLPAPEKLPEPPIKRRIQE
jgi:hypothetical protein